jgi:hypothetical protein
VALLLTRESVANRAFFSEKTPKSLETVDGLKKIFDGIKKIFEEIKTIASKIKIIRE